MSNVMDNFAISNQIDEGSLNKFKASSGRVCDFTFNYFFTWFWICTLVFVFVFTIFVTVYRKLRGDEATFLEKLGYKAKGLKQIYQQREQELE